MQHDTQRDIKADNRLADAYIWSKYLTMCAMIIGLGVAASFWLVKVSPDYANRTPIIEATK